MIYNIHVYYFVGINYYNIKKFTLSKKKKKKNQRDFLNLSRKILQQKGIGLNIGEILRVKCGSMM